MCIFDDLKMKGSVNIVVMLGREVFLKHFFISMYFIHFKCPIPFKINKNIPVLRESERTLKIIDTR